RTDTDVVAIGVDLQPYRLEVGGWRRRRMPVRAVGRGWRGLVPGCRVRRMAGERHVLPTRHGGSGRWCMAAGLRPVARCGLRQHATQRQKQTERNGETERLHGCLLRRKPAEMPALRQHASVPPQPMTLRQAIFTRTFTQRIVEPVTAR